MLNLSQSDCRHGGIAFAAGEDLSLKAGFLVKLNAGKDLILPTSDQDLTPYVITQGADQGYLCGAVPLSSAVNARVELFGTCEAGTMLVAKGDGRVTAYTAGSDARVIGVAEEPGIEGQHVLLRPVSVGVKGTDGADGEDGAAGAAGAAGRDAGVLVLPRSTFPVDAPSAASLVGYLVFLGYSMEGGYEWAWSFANTVGNAVQYVVIAEDANNLTLFPMGGNASTTAPHTIPLPVTLPVSLVLAGTPSAAGFIGPLSENAMSAFAILGYSDTGNEFVGLGSAQMKVVTVTGSVMTLIDGGGVSGGT